MNCPGQPVGPDDGVKPAVSIIMPAFNGALHIGEAIASVIGQTCSEWELIVVDDGSLDATADIVQRFRDNRIRYRYQHNRGQAAARNIGIDIANGGWIAFLDQDDLWVPSKLERQLDAAAREKADVVFSDGVMFQIADGRRHDVPFATVCGRFEGAEFFPLLFEMNRVPVLSAMIKRGLLERVRLDERENVRNCDDYDLWLTLARAGATFFGMPDLLVQYRLHPAQASQDLVQQRAAELTVLEKHATAIGLPITMKRQRLRAAYDEHIRTLMEANRVRDARSSILRRGAVHVGGLVAALQWSAVTLIPNRVAGLNRRLYAFQDFLRDRKGSPNSLVHAK